MSKLRRILIELWSMMGFAAIMGFLGPFGTYLEAEFPTRAFRWWIHLMGAYVLVRPSIHLWAVIADATRLPRSMLIFWGVVVSSFPLALVWRWGASVFFHALGGFAGILPFALLSAMTVLAVVWWSRRADDRLSGFPSEGPVHPVTGRLSHAMDAEMPASKGEISHVESHEGDLRPRLMGRLKSGFQGPITALQSEDHYVRVHGSVGSQLVFMRLRDAIGEMDGCPGQQVHRSWWVASSGIAFIETDGRNRIIFLPNGQSVPVARDSVSRLRQSGFLPG